MNTTLTTATTQSGGPRAFEWWSYLISMIGNGLLITMLRATPSMLVYTCIYDAYHQQPTRLLPSSSGLASMKLPEGSPGNRWARFFGH